MYPWRSARKKALKGRLRSGLRRTVSSLATVALGRSGLYAPPARFPRFDGVIWFILMTPNRALIVAAGFCGKDGIGDRVALALLNLLPMDGPSDGCGGGPDQHG